MVSWGPQTSFARDSATVPHLRVAESPSRFPKGMRVKTFRSVRDAEGKFVQISNKLAQDSRLSLRATGLVLYALPSPPDQPHTYTSIAAANKEGREAVRTALKELEDLGYYRITRVQARDGSWATETELSDAPKTRNPAP